MVLNDYTTCKIETGKFGWCYLNLCEITVLVPLKIKKTIESLIIFLELSSNGCFWRTSTFQEIPIAVNISNHLMMSYAESDQSLFQLKWRSANGWKFCRNAGRTLWCGLNVWQLWNFMVMIRWLLKMASKLDPLNFISCTLCFCPDSHFIFSPHIKLPKCNSSEFAWRKNPNLMF